MPWTGDWDNLVGRIKINTAEQIRQALVERAAVAGVAVEPFLQVPFQGIDHSQAVAGALDSLFNDIIDKWTFFDPTFTHNFFMLQGYLDAIGASSREGATSDTLQLAAWAKQLHDMINLMTWTIEAASRFAATAVPYQTRRSGGGHASYADAVSDWLAAPWAAGGHRARHYIHHLHIRRTKTEWTWYNYVNTTAINHRSEFYWVFDWPFFDVSGTIRSYENNDYPGFLRLTSRKAFEDAAPNTNNSVSFFVGAFETVTVTDPHSKARHGWDFRQNMATIRTQWDVAGGLEFVA